YLTDALKREIREVLPNTKADGFYIKRRVYFMDRWIRHGGFYPCWLLRLFRKGKGRCEDREMDEHILLNGKFSRLENDFIDENKKGLEFFIHKHSQYAEREARDIYNMMDQKTSKSFYLRWPKFLRP